MSVWLTCATSLFAATDAVIYLSPQSDLKSF